jgi:hypothetical protein
MCHVRSFSQGKGDGRIWAVELLGVNQQLKQRNIGNNFYLFIIITIF